jgi:hypothetical protein
MAATWRKKNRDALCVDCFRIGDLKLESSEILYNSNFPVPNNKIPREIMHTVYVGTDMYSVLSTDRTVFSPVYLFVLS